MQETEAIFTTDVVENEENTVECVAVEDSIDEKDIVGKVLSETWQETGEAVPMWMPTNKHMEASKDLTEWFKAGFYKMWHNKRKIEDKVFVTETSLQDFLMKCFYWWKKGYEPSLKSDNYAWEILNTKAVVLCKYAKDPEVKEDPVKKAFLEKYSEQMGAALVGVPVDAPEKRGRKKKIV